MKILALGTVAVAATLASSAWAGQTEMPATPAAATPAKECHRLFHEGSLVGQPVCRTAKEWAATRNYIQREIRQYQLSFLTHGL